jgi:hypothetical protein
MSDVPNTTLRCVWLWLRIVFRKWDDGIWLDPVLAWRMSRCVFPRNRT